jgi:hypothetical protein
VISRSKEQLLILTIQYIRDLWYYSTGPSSLSTAHQSYFKLAMSKDLVLSTGEYYIRNEGIFAGRNRHEDFSLNPKAIFCPTDDPKGQLVSNLYSVVATRSDPFNLLQWTIQALPNGRYKLLAGGNPTGERNKLLYALLIEEEKAEEWIITKQERSGQYT